MRHQLRIFDFMEQAQIDLGGQQKLIQLIFDFQRRPSAFWKLCCQRMSGSLIESLQGAIFGIVNMVNMRMKKPGLARVFSCAKRV